FRAAQEHYDDPSAAVARVVAGEDEHGIWVAGWLLPGASAEALEVFRSSPVSGDWRRVGGSLELIGVCSVNTPGFPVRRVHFAAGSQRALIGSFGITPTTGHFAAPRSVQVNETEQARARWAWAAAATNTED
ncbi:MAG: putative actinophage protein, partial [Nonomuraea muscovyensis]|nr:putative actinophage protein [Nonomuraea muscovyensis]